MDVHPNTAEFAHWPITSDVDLTNATFEVYLEGAWRAGTWEGPATQDDEDLWHRTARIQIAGSLGAPGLVINTSHRYPEYRVTVGGETIVRASKYSLMVRP